MEPYSIEDLRKSLDWLLSACRIWLLNARNTRSGSGSNDKGLIPDSSHIDLTGDPALHLLKSSDLDWNILNKMAYFQGVESILFDLHRKRILSQKTIPQKLITDWEQVYFGIVIQNTRFVDLLTQILSGAEKENIRLIALKGMASSFMLYRDPGLRAMADIDILCQTKDLRTLAPILHGLGFQKRGHIQGHHIGYHHQKLGILVEFHFALQYIVANKNELMSLFWKHRRWTETDDIRIPVLSTEDQLIFEMAHVLDHVYNVSIKHFLDILGWLTLFEEKIDWEYFSSALAKSGMREEFVCLGRSLSELFQIPLDIPVKTEPSPKKIEDRINGLNTALMARGFIKTSQTGARIKSYATLSHMIRFTGRKLFPPLPVIRAAYNRPSSISSLFSYPYHIYETLLDFRSRKKRDKAP